MACPICRGFTQEPKENPHTPFCSERCKLIDLGKWLGEGHRIDRDAPPVPPPLGETKGRLS